MKNNNSDITFRRIKGRIVPIQKQKAQGIKNIALGALLGLTGTHITMQSLHKAERIKAFGASTALGAIIAKRSKQEEVALKLANKTLHLNKRYIGMQNMSKIGLGVSILGMGIIGYNINKLKRNK